MALKGVRFNLITKDGHRKSWTPGIFAPKVRDGWVTLGRFGKYRVDSMYANIRDFRSKFWPIDPRDKEEWEMFWNEGNPEPIAMRGAAIPPTQSAELIGMAMDSTWIRQALRRPGWDIITIICIVSVIANLALSVGLVAAALR